MAVKKSELYSSLWSSCDELRGSMDASQYKDYVLVLLFVKYVSDKYAGQPYPAIMIPKGASFKDMAALKGKSDIGDQINKKIIGPLFEANKLSDPPDFNDPAKLGSGKEMVAKLDGLIGIFENPALDFSKNRAEGDDILGDAYEYLMRHFATESGKSKGQFYTPAEVSRVMARLIGIGTGKISNKTSVYDPTCGSGSLLLKVADEARHGKGINVTLYGQEKDSATSGLARMNMILHDNAGASIHQGNTLANPLFKDDSGALKTFDFVVANPPFSDKRWSTGLDPENDLYERFEHYGIPPAKKGDFAYLLHIVRSLKSTGKGACILPHGVLFRGNAEATIRKNLVVKRYIKAIIGLPPNLFYGTGIPACIVIIDKEDAEARKGIFMIDASKGFIKDGNKNRLREQDIHKIIDTYQREATVERYSRMVPLSEISNSKNEFNLNLPRYIDSSDPEDTQDIDGHLRGGIPERDVDALGSFWKVLPGIRGTLFKKADRSGYCLLKVPAGEVKAAIVGHAEFQAFTEAATKLFARWRTENIPQLRRISKGAKPKPLIEKLSEDLLACFEKAPLVDPYDVYQHLMDYWAEAMQDDCYLIVADGWVAKPYRIIETDKKGKTKDKGWACDLIPKTYIVARYFAKEQALLEARQSELEAASACRAELEEEHGGEEDALGSLDNIAKVEVNARLKEIKGNAEFKDEGFVLERWLELSSNETALKRAVREAESTLDSCAYEKYPKLSENEIKALVIEDKWMARLNMALQGELDRLSQALSGRIRQLAGRYAAPLPMIEADLAKLAGRVDTHLKKLGAFRGEWKPKTLGDLFAFSGGYSASRDQLSSEGHCYLHYGDIHGSTKAFVDVESENEDIPKLKIALSRVSRASLLEDGDVVFVDASEDDEGTSKHVVVINPKKVPFISGLHTIVAKGKTDELDRGYRRYCFQTSAIKRQFKFYAVGTKVSGISKKNIAKLTLPVPPLPEQVAMAEVLSDIDAELVALEKRRDKMRAVKQAVMQQLLADGTQLT